MAKSLDPIVITEGLQAEYRRSITTAFPVADVELRDRLHALLAAEDSLYREPFIEGVQPFKTKGKLSEYIKPTFLHSEIRTLFDDSRILYAHQVEALDQFIIRGNNIVVASGTGSGKTETFLLPIIDRLLKENQETRSKRGIRAILLYPMNALVNDQVKRLTGLLLRQSERANPIRFGFYTSATEGTPASATAKLEADLRADETLCTIVKSAINLSDDAHSDDFLQEAKRKISRVQALSREEMWESPPDILVTNYSMLGYMLQRPVERTMFEKSRNTFRILVMDEAHTYVGARGAEVSRLIRRVKHATGIPTSGHMRAILTSASLGSETTEAEVTAYARDLTGESFGSVIRGERTSLSERSGPPFEMPAGSDWRYLETLNDTLKQASDEVSVWRDSLNLFVPAAQLERARQAASGLPRSGRVPAFLWHALAPHPWVQAVAQLLSDTPERFDDLAVARSLWEIDLEKDGNGVTLPDEREAAKRALAVLLQLGALARRTPDELPALPVRLHLVFKGLDGVFACINPRCPDRPSSADPHLPGFGSLSLTPRSSCEHCKSLVLPLATCEHCGFDFVVVKQDEKAHRLVAADPSAMFDSDNHVVVLTRADALGVSDGDEDGDGSVDETDGASAGAPAGHDTKGWVRLRVTPNGRWQMDVTKEPPRDANDGAIIFRTARPLMKPERGRVPAPVATPGYPTKCPNCGATNSQISRVIRPFRSDADAPPQALLNALMPLLDASDGPANDFSENLVRPARARTLVFSDSRQEAAYLAATYGMSASMQTYRQLVVGVVRREFESDPTRLISLNWLHEKIRDEFLSVNIRHPHSDSNIHQTSFALRNRAQERDFRDRASRRAISVIMREFCTTGRRRQSLEGLGLVAAHVILDQEKRTLATTALGLPPAAGFVIQVVADIVRLWSCTQPPGKADDNAGELFLDLRGQVDARGFSTIKLRSDDGGRPPNQRVQERVFRPRSQRNGSTSHHRLSDYLTRVLGRQLSDAEWLGLWRAMDDVWTAPGGQYGHDVRLINWTSVEVKPGVGLVGWHRCDKCRTLVHLEGETGAEAQWRACWTFRCKGTMQTVPANEGVPQTFEEDDHHLRRRLRAERRLAVSVEEHTAQIDTQELQKREARFLRGETQVLSCSTTLELGVDIGELNAVFLRNAPPTAANYQQRAGRAGRRADGVALVAMFAQRRPHDRYHFVQPERLIAGHVDKPSIGPVNNVITRRHLYSELLYAFLTETAGKGVEHITCGDFLGVTENSRPTDAFPAGDCLADRIDAWLESSERDVLINGIAPKLWDGQAPELRALRDGFRQALAAWMSEIKATWSALAEIYEEVRTAADASGIVADRNQLVGREKGINAEIKKVLGRRLHENLAHAGVLPVYGFPIDVVPLLTWEGGNPASGDFRLERDRRLALIEYAPGRDLIVSGFSIRSAGIVRPASLEKKEWWTCTSCGHFWAGIQGDLGGAAEVGDNAQARPCGNCNGRGHVRRYRVPRQFTVDPQESKKPVLNARPFSVAMTDVFLMERLSEDAVRETPLDRFLEVRLGEQRPLFMANQGLRTRRGQSGFHICAKCGRSLDPIPDSDDGAVVSRATRPSHKDLMTGKECNGLPALFDLGHEFRSDILTISFKGAHLPDLPIYWQRKEGSQEGGRADHPDAPKDFWHSLLQALLVSGARTIGVPRSDLDGLLMPSISTGGGESGSADITLYDAVSGGAGYAHLLVNRLPDVFREALRICRDCTCERSCYACLRDRRNERHHEILDRHLVKDALAPLFEALDGDPVAMAFAPDARRLSSRRAIDSLRVACGSATRAVFQLNSLGPVPLSNSHSADTSWLDLIEIAARPGHPVELRLVRLPDVDTPLGQFQRARVRALVELGTINLKLARDYRNSPNVADTVIIAGNPQVGDRAFQAPSNMAADGHATDQWYVVETRDGVQHVLNGLPNPDLFQEVRDGSRVLPPDVYFAQFSPDQRVGSIEEFLLYLGIDNTIDRVISAKYSDPYVWLSTCGFLRQILQSLRVSNLVPITLTTRFNNRTRNNTSTPPPTRDELQRALSPYSTQITDHHVDHGRYLDLRTSTHSYKLVFDSGIDQFELQNSDVIALKQCYVVTERRALEAIAEQSGMTR